MEKLIDILMNYVEVDEITAEMEFKKDLGLASFDTVCLIDDISAELGKDLEPNDFVTFKTVGEMANHLGL